MIDKLQMFIALARERHFGRAAEACGVTQPSLSAAIRQLEEQLGVQLVHRGSRFQDLTPEGQRVLERAIRIVGDIRDLRDEMRVVRAGLSGHLRLGVIPTALPMVVELTRPFLERHPGISLSILSRTSSEILAGIERLELEAGITYLENEPLGRVTSQPLYTEYYRFLCTADSPLAKKPSISWTEAAAQPLCLLSADMQNRRIVNQRLAAAGVMPAIRVDSNSTIVLVSHVATGGWASVVPRRLAEMFARSEGLVSLPLTADRAEPEPGHLIGLIAARRDPQTPLLAALLDEAARLHRRIG